jgi:hypothetical protein
MLSAPTQTQTQPPSRPSSSIWPNAPHHGRFHPQRRPPSHSGRTAFSNDPLCASPYDDHVIAFVGDVLASAAPVLLPDDSFSRAADLTVYNTAHMTCGVNGHGTAGGAVVRLDHQASGTQNTDDYCVHCVMVLPPDESSDFLSRNPTGIYNSRTSTTSSSSPMQPPRYLPFVPSGSLSSNGGVLLV